MDPATQDGYIERGLIAGAKYYVSRDIGEAGGAPDFAQASKPSFVQAGIRHIIKEMGITGMAHDQPNGSNLAGRCRKTSAS